MKHDNMESLLDTLKDFFSFSPDARQFLSFIEKQGRDASLVRSIEMIPRLSRQEFERKLLQIKKRAEILGISEKEYPLTYDDYLALEKNAAQSRGILKQFTIKYPNEMKSHEIGLCPVGKMEHGYYLPGLHLAGYGRDIVLGPKGAEEGHHRIMFSSQDVHQFWFGLELLHALCIAKGNIEYLKENEDLEKVAREIAQVFISGRKIQSDQEKIQAQIEADRLIAGIFLHKFPEFKDILDSCKFSTELLVSDELRLEKTIETTQQAVRLTLEKINNVNYFPTPATELESQVREVLVAKMIFCQMLPGNLLMALYYSVGLAKSDKPFIQLP